MRKGAPPKATVLMSCYNAERWLEESIESVLSQSYCDYELLLINDGSTDNTLNVLNKYKSIDSRVKIINKANTGLADSLNCGLKIAQGEWLVRLDADDLCYENRLYEQMYYLNRNKDVILLGSGFTEIDEHGRFIKEHRYPISHKGLLRNLEKLKRFFPHSSVFFKLNIVKKLAGYSTLLWRSEDSDLWLRLAEVGRIACVGKSLVKVRKHQDQISNHKGTLIHGVASCVCYFTRQYVGKDPRCLLSESEWQYFLLWIEKRLNDYGYFKRVEEWAKLRDSYLHKESSVQRILFLGKSLLELDDTTGLLLEKALGSNLPKKLALEFFRR